MTIKDLRTERGMSQEQLARALKVTRQTIMYWEDQRGLPSGKNLLRLAQFFDVPVEKILEEFQGVK